jgi:hypothetical protein
MPVLVYKYITMDKSLWLRVIRQELGLLDQLASGMIDDPNLSREEVELALVRSNAVVREFEMLLNRVIRQEEEAALHASGPVQGKPAEIAEPLIAAEEIPVVELKKATGNKVEPPAEPVPEPVVSVKKAEEEAVQPVSIRDVPSDTVKDANILNITEQQEHTQFKAAPLRSLKEGLSLNDRYLFQRELFDNDKARLDNTVAALDQLGSIREAVEYLKANFRWNKSEASEKFVHLVKRRFS